MNARAFREAVERRILLERDARMSSDKGVTLPTTLEIIEDGRTSQGRQLVRDAILRERASHPAWSPEEIAREVECSPITVRRVIRVAESSRGRVTPRGELGLVRLKGKLVRVELPVIHDGEIEREGE